VNTDVLTDLGERFGIRSIPTLTIFVGGRAAKSVVGVRPAEQIEALIADAAPPVHSRHA
jgi:thioredoxin 1